MDSSLTLRGFVLLLVFLVAAPLSKASFACGYVNDAANQSSSWMDVRVYLSEEPENFATCKINPENKYCCDLEKIPSKEKWKIGKVVSAKIIDEKGGYYASPVSIKSTGEGFNVMPNLSLEKAIEIKRPKTSIVYSKGGQVQFKVKVSKSFDSIGIFLQNKTLAFCSNCTKLNKKLKMPFGENALRFLAASKEDNISVKKNLTVVKEISFKRTFKCEGCRKNKIKPSREVNITLSIKANPNIKEKILREFVPSSWKIIKVENASIKNYSRSHKILEWKINSPASISYTLKSPQIWFRPRRYVFKSKLNDLQINKQKVTVYRFFQFLGKDIGEEELKISSKEYYSSPKNPVVLEKEGILVAIFPKENIKIKAELAKEKGIFEDVLKINTNIGEPIKVYVKSKNPNAEAITSNGSKIGLGDFEGFVSGIEYIKIKKQIFGKILGIFRILLSITK